MKTLMILVSLILIYSATATASTPLSPPASKATCVDAGGNYVNYKTPSCPPNDERCFQIKRDCSSFWTEADEDEEEREEEEEEREETCEQYEEDRRTVMAACSAARVRNCGEDMRYCAANCDIDSSKSKCRRRCSNLFASSLETKEEQREIAQEAFDQASESITDAIERKQDREQENLDKITSLQDQIQQAQDELQTNELDIQKLVSTGELRNEQKLNEYLAALEKTESDLEGVATEVEALKDEAKTKEEALFQTCETKSRELEGQKTSIRNNDRINRRNFQSSVSAAIGTTKKVKNCAVGKRKYNIKTRSGCDILKRVVRCMATSGYTNGMAKIQREYRVGLAALERKQKDIIRAAKQNDRGLKLALKSINAEQREMAQRLTLKKRSLVIKISRLQSQITQQEQLQASQAQEDRRQLAQLEIQRSNKDHALRLAENDILGSSSLSADKLDEVAEAMAILQGYSSDSDDEVFDTDNSIADDIESCSPAVRRFFGNSRGDL